ncbi:MAG: type II toxin-antitoxin system VapC family toxin [Acidobacteria bacterium]|nr:MAG: type II toxin-antitoxin system VapC family toxin [Acidobacteriota bacterium]
MPTTVHLPADLLESVDLRAKELMKGDPDVGRRLLAHKRTDVYVPQPVFAEIEYGLSRLGRSTRKGQLRARFDTISGQLQRLGWTDEVSRSFGVTKADLEKRGVRIEDFDVAIAAHALAGDATLVTDNVAHLKRIRNLRLENWRR